MPSCLLTRAPGTNRFTAQAGTLTLVLSDVVGNTAFSPLQCTVFDVSIPGTHDSPPFTATTSSFKFDMVAGKKYLISLACSQLVDPLSAQAQVKEEPCGQTIDAVTLVNLFPGYIIESVQ
ncbi:hypothetical protein HDF16_003584 [Granulicella aggregans]|uniref:Uncharacterized protein n=1 Tax=Granulicella aggregans TaxID=474949 RepID=A0A7W8E4T2_9BACT|nr:hypothetical protein [Granulicella aggregans]MBB5058861.1 hypothetical protein [Granulicella aggregans]